jgi:hypothetical protein
MKSLFCEDSCAGKLCVRRVMGVTGFLSFIAGVFAGVEHDALQLLGTLSMLLLGITTVDKFVKNS